MTVLRLSTLYHSPTVASLAKVPAWQLALDIIDLFRILLLLVVAHAAAIALHLAIVVYCLQNPCPCLA
jgi:hypothetical protein